MKLNLKLTSLLLGTCILACPTASAMMEEDSSDRPCAAATAEDINLEIGEAYRSVLPFPSRRSSYRREWDKYHDIGTVSQAPGTQSTVYGDYEVGGRLVINATKVYDEDRLSAIAAQCPRNISELSAITQMVLSDDVNVIVAIGEFGEDLCSYWNVDPLMRTIKPCPQRTIMPLYTCYTGKCIKTGEGKGYTVYDVTFCEYKAGEVYSEKTIPLYHYHDWKAGPFSKPKNADDFYEFVKKIASLTQQGKLRLLAHCHAGTSRTGVFLAYLKALLDGNLADIHTAGDAIEFAKKVVSELSSRRTFMFKPEQFDMFCKMLLGHLHLI